MLFLSFLIMQFFCYSDGKCWKLSNILQSILYIAYVFFANFWYCSVRKMICIIEKYWDLATHVVLNADLFLSFPLYLEFFRYFSILQIFIAMRANFKFSPVVFFFTSWVIIYICEYLRDCNVILANFYVAVL